MNDTLAQFKQKYRAHVQEGRMRFAKPKPFAMWSDSDPELFDSKTFEYENSVQIDMPVHEFETLAEMDAYFRSIIEGPFVGGHAEHIVNEHERELRLRNQHPALREAYQQYLTLLNLVR
jgi:hypothetical protein